MINMEHQQNDHSNSNDDLDAIIHDILNQAQNEELDYISSNDTDVQRLDLLTAQAEAFFEKYCVDNELLSENLISGLLDGHSLDFYDSLDDVDRDKMIIFRSIAATHSYLYICEQDNHYVTYGEGIENVQKLIGEVAQVFSTEYDRSRWYKAIRETILPLVNEVSEIDLDSAIEQADLLKSIQDIEDSKSADEKNMRQAAYEVVINFLESKYGIHDDMQKVARLVVTVAKIRYLGGGLDIYEDQLNTYLDRYPLAETCVDATVQFISSHLDR